jgi:hypothetical protein
VTGGLTRRVRRWRCGQTLRGRTNAVVDVARRMAQHEEEWRDRCAAMQELRRLLRGYELRVGNQREEDEDEEQEQAELALFSPDNLQVLTQPLRSTLTDLRSSVVKEACATFADLARTVGPAKCRILVRDLFPTLLDARGTANKACRAALAERLGNFN